jgi:hypothetical protein
MYNDRIIMAMCAIAIILIFVLCILCTKIYRKVNVRLDDNADFKYAKSIGEGNADILSKIKKETEYARKREERMASQIDAIYQRSKSRYEHSTQKSRWPNDSSTKKGKSIDVDTKTLPSKKPVAKHAPVKSSASKTSAFKSASSRHEWE